MMIQLSSVRQWVQQRIAGAHLSQHIDDPLTDAVLQAMTSFQQGDLLEQIQEISVIGRSGRSYIDTPLGVVVISQTCDILRANLPFVHVAPRRQLPASSASEARSGRRPRYVHLPAVGPEDFADLSEMCSVHKNVLAAAASRTRCLSSDRDVSRFGKSIARNFSRFAFPDAVSEYLQPFSRRVQAKAGKTNSAEGRQLEKVVQLRVESLSGWQASAQDLRIVIVVESGTLPLLPNDEMPDIDEELYSWIYDGNGVPRRGPSEIAEKLEEANGAAERHLLWAALGDTWIELCRAKTNPGSTLALTCEVVSVDDFSLARVLESEILDLDHLSTKSDDVDSQ